MHVPETAVDIDDLPQPWENEVRRARQGPDVQTVTVAQGVDELADQPFGSGVL